ncbi:non-hydrolyzing UDP-N-acetylglucosamine 2-epimerase [Massilibacteroides vaginae]|uniref:non-hydrolyzing UDP-N-acetylglucosamine 2-epimerase n=1 Tax=Massilibacteroides vaginae TaxID=1673718 RepID=UPI000A1CD9DD|nr:UDP-N-acetylglucosamine 2-epimerase (non-hydrolyzing) [Massilibacteroides vaginae]
MKVITIVGARPQFIKAAMVSHAIHTHNRKNNNQIEELLIHTGQHYDEAMSRIFFQEMCIPTPTWQLNCGNISHGAMTGRMLEEIESILLKEKPDYVLVYGDTNSTLAGALAASKLQIPVAHVEAGLRSFNSAMPEEINRILTDHIASALFCPTKSAVEQLKNEGILNGVHHVGDVMYDAALTFGKIAEQSSPILQSLKLNRKQFRLCTVHRAENTDNQERLTGIFRAIEEIATEDYPVVLPLHPRTKVCLERFGLTSQNPYLRIIPPVSFLDMILLEKHAFTILTDSGGVQKEAYFHQTPCITLRNETEWVETVAAGWNQIAGYEKENILNCIASIPTIREEIVDYGTGKAAERIISLL